MWATTDAGMKRLLQTVAPPPDGDSLLHMDATAQYLGEEIRKVEPLTGEDWQRAALLVQDAVLRADEPMRSMLSWLDEGDDEVFEEVRQRFARPIPRRAALSDRGGRCATPRGDRRRQARAPAHGGHRLRARPARAGSREVVGR